MMSSLPQTSDSRAPEPPRPSDSQLSLGLPEEPASAASAAGRTARSGAPVWLQRISLFVLVLFCVYLGVLVMVLPWMPRVWDHNLFIQSRPALAALLHTGAMRGVVSGLGLIDIWIGISEAVHYRDHRG